MARRAIFSIFEVLHVKHLRALFLLAALSPSFAWTAPAGAEASRVSEDLNLADAERRAADLKQGMSIEDVQALLGKPRRTSLKNSGGSGSPQGTLLWTYNWTGSSATGGLRVTFVSKTPNAWSVNSWEWANY
ncbi:MAG TPA: hypothetical protein VLV56_13935 [Burkholderiales bacterium]|nr:hypothetical protein [Burkholderiales bacterium]